MSNENNNDINLLNEIFAKPSDEVKSDRFAEPTEAAPCRAHCSGSCGSLAV